MTYQGRTGAILTLQNISSSQHLHSSFALINSIFSEMRFINSIIFIYTLTIFSSHHPRLLCNHSVGIHFTVFDCYSADLLLFTTASRRYSTFLYAVPPCFKTFNLCFKEFDPNLLLWTDILCTRRKKVQNASGTYLTVGVNVENSRTILVRTYQFSFFLAVCASISIYDTKKQKNSKVEKLRAA